MLFIDLNYNFECDWFVELSDNKLSDNKLSDNNLASELVGNRSFLNQSQLRKLSFLWLQRLSVTRARRRQFFIFENKIQVDFNQMFLFRIQLNPREQEHRGALSVSKLCLSQCFELILALKYLSWH